MPSDVSDSHVSDSHVSDSHRTDSHRTDSRESSANTDMSISELMAEVAKDCDRLDWDDYFISMAFLISARSACERLHVGCVLVKDTRVVSVGYNGFLPGAPHVSRVDEGHEQATVHAEQNCIADCAKRGVGVDGATAFITHYPCVNCVKILAASGVNCVKYYHDYKNSEVARELLSEAGIRVVRLGKTPRSKG